MLRVRVTLFGSALAGSMAVDSDAAVVRLVGSTTAVLNTGELLMSGALGALEVLSAPPGPSVSTCVLMSRIGVSVVCVPLYSVP